MKVKRNATIEQDVNCIEVPNLWHIAQKHPAADEREAILETWHLAHALLKKLREVAKAEGARRTHDAVVQQARRHYGI